MSVFIKKNNFLTKIIRCVLICGFAQSAGAVEFTECSSAEGKTPTPTKCPDNDTKQSDSEVSVML